MSSSCPPRWWSRLLRKQLLLVAAVGVIVLAVCAPAFADDEPPARAAVPPDTTALARASIVAGRLDEALRLLGRTIMSDRSADERATAFEMRAVVDRWVALGGTIAPRSAPAPLPGTGTGAGAATDEASAASPDAWESAFAVSCISTCQRSISSGAFCRAVSRGLGAQAWRMDSGSAVACSERRCRNQLARRATKQSAARAAARPQVENRFASNSGGNMRESYPHLSPQAKISLRRGELRQGAFRAFAAFVPASASAATGR